MCYIIQHSGQSVNNIRSNTDSGYVSVLVLLDLSAAFDTVDHRILLHRLEKWVGLSRAVLNWFRSNLEGRSYFVTIGSYESERVAMTCGVPRGQFLDLFCLTCICSLWVRYCRTLISIITVMQTIHNFVCLCHQTTAAQQMYCVSVWRK